MLIHRVDGTIAYKSIFSDIKSAIQDLINRKLSLRNLNLYKADLTGLVSKYADWTGVCLEKAKLDNSDLQHINLRNANLKQSSFSHCKLNDVSFVNSEIEDSNFDGSNLNSSFLDASQSEYFQSQNIEGVIADQSILKQLPQLTSPFEIYKLINGKNEGIFRGGLKYIVGETVEVAKYNSDPKEECGAGISVATLSWCISRFDKDLKGEKTPDEKHSILKIKVDPADIVCVPEYSTGKIRVKKCFVVDRLDNTLIGK